MVYSADDITVVETNSSGVDMVRSQGAGADQYFVSAINVDAGANITFTTARTDGNIITVYRDQALTRATSLALGGGYSPERLNLELNALLMLLQQVNNSLSRTITSEITDSDAVFVIPKKADRLGKILYFDPITGDLDVIASSSDSAIAAAASAALAAVYAAGLAGTSTTSIAIASGAKTFTTQAGKQWVAGQFLQIASAANSANYMHGSVTSYSGTTLIMNITDVGGSGTKTDWVISVSGSQGTTGATGAAGTLPVSAGAGTVNAITGDYSPDLTLTDKVLCIVRSPGPNTSTTPTFAPDGLTAHTITTRGGAPIPLGATGAVGYPLFLQYQSSGTMWELLNPCEQVSTTVTALTSTSNSVAVDFSKGNSFSHALTENTTIANPSNATAGMRGVIYGTQHASAAKTLAFAANWKTLDGSTPIAPTTLSAPFMISWTAQSSSIIWYSLSANGVA